MGDLPAGFAANLSTVVKAQEELVKSNEQLTNAVSNSKKNGLPHIAIGPAQGQFLALVCRLMGAKNILEIGTLGGYSTIWFAQSAPDVKVTSIEFNPKHRDVATENTKGLSNVEVILGAALEILPKLAEKGRVFDFIFIDASWEEQREYFDWAVKMLRTKGCIFVDNAVRQLTESEESDPTRWALIDYVKNDERVDATLIPILNTEKTILSELADGFVMALKK